MINNTIKKQEKNIVSKIPNDISFTEDKNGKCYFKDGDFTLTLGLSDSNYPREIDVYLGYILILHTGSFYFSINTFHKERLLKILENNRITSIEQISEYTYDIHFSNDTKYTVNNTTIFELWKTPSKKEHINEINSTDKDVFLDKDVFFKNESIVFQSESIILSTHYENAIFILYIDENKNTYRSMSEIDLSLWKKLQSTPISKFTITSPYSFMITFADGTTTEEKALLKGFPNLTDKNDWKNGQYFDNTYKATPEELKECESIIKILTNENKEIVFSYVHKGEKIFSKIIDLSYKKLTKNRIKCIVQEKKDSYLLFFFDGSKIRITNNDEEILK